MMAKHHPAISARRGNRVTPERYTPPSWVKKEDFNIPATRIRLAQLPTPIQPFDVPGLEDVKMFIKRDDLTGMALSGNKVRKLEFLLADAIDKGADTTVTIGGIQSNHARATAVASRYCGLDSHLVLRTSKLVVDEDPGLVGNLLVERMIGASVHLCTKEEYGKVGSVRLGEMVRESLTEQGKKPYVIPVGGSNALGSWGYMEMVQELKEQLEVAAADANAVPSSFDNLVVACGSGGTVAGIGLALDAAGLGAKLTAYGVCDSPEYFYNYVDMLLADMRTENSSTNKAARDLVTVVNAKGLGYAISTDEELAFVHEVALKTGVILDPVYSGKALYNFVEDVKKNPEVWSGKQVLFVHTGGLLGMYDKTEQLQPLIGARNDVFRMKVE